MSWSQRNTPPVKAPFTSGSLMISQHKERFAEVTEDVTYRGFNFVITLGDVDFQVRHYDDLPGLSTVISPKTAHLLPQTRTLAGYLVSVLGCRKLLLHCERSETYREVNMRTLGFVTTEACIG
jgi:hypothetical protein